MRPGHIFRKPFLIVSMRLAVVGLKIATCKYWANSGFEVCARMLYTTFLIVVTAVSLPTFLSSLFLPL